MTKLTALFAVVFTSLALQAHAAPNFHNLVDPGASTDREPGDGMSRPYTDQSVKNYTNQQRALLASIDSYFLVNNYMSNRGFMINSVDKIQDGVWWETTAAKKKTIFLVKFIYFSSPSDRYQDNCSVRFERVENQGGSGKVAVNAASKKCTRVMLER